MAAQGRCLVTGAAGFIGSALVRHLEAEQREVWRLVRPGSSTAGAPRTLAVDLAEKVPPLGRLEAFDAIFHLAGRAHQRDSPRTELAEHRRANVDGTENLLAAATDNGARLVVFASSVAAMGSRANPAGEHLSALDESAPPAPVTAYGRTKLEAEELVLANRDSRGPQGVVLRLPMVYGPGQKGNLDRLLRAIARRRFPPPPRSSHRRSVIHVDDVVAALVLAARHPAAAGRLFLISEPEPCSTRAIYDWTCEALGRRPAGWGVPATVLRALGRLGDGAALIAGRRTSFDSIAIDRLLGDAWYSGELIEREIGFVPRRRLRDVLPLLVRELVDRKSATPEAT